jgi:hypothetical protein
VPVLQAPMRRPVPLACSATFFGLLLLTTGLSGFTLSRHEAFAAGTRWTGGPIWTQVAIGAALLAVSIWSWRRAMASLRA